MPVHKTLIQEARTKEAAKEDAQIMEDLAGLVIKIGVLESVIPEMLRRWRFVTARLAARAVVRLLDQAMEKTKESNYTEKSALLFRFSLPLTRWSLLVNPLSAFHVWNFWRTLWADCPERFRKDARRIQTVAFIMWFIPPLFLFTVAFWWGFFALASWGTKALGI